MLIGHSELFLQRYDRQQLEHDRAQQPEQETLAFDATAAMSTCDLPDNLKAAVDAQVSFNDHH